MAYSRRLGVIGVLGVSWLLAIGCGSDDDKNVNAGDAGEAGESTGGTPSSGGSSSTAGKGGTGTAGKGGNAGAAGKGGNASAGTTNVAGASDGGAGGSPDVPVGGTSNAGADAGGAGGEGGAGTAPSAKLLQCGDQCQVDDDCLIDGAIEQKICDEVSKRCVSATRTACEAAADCAPWAAFWEICDTSDDCDPESQKCVTWQGVGYCAWLPECLPGDQVVNLPEHGNVDPAGFDVCVTPGACVDGSCSVACEITECPAGNGGLCDSETHQCGCESNDECEATHICSNGKCQQCVVDDDCPAGTTGLDKCVNGKCGCSGAAACPDQTASATPVCE